jgi:hypothetical protein
VPALAPPPCTQAAARAAILASRPLASLAPTLENGGGVDRIICADLTGDGVRDLAATIFSGGTAGDTAWVVFRADGSRWRLAFRNLQAYEVGLFRAGRDLLESQPIYEKNDPNCCPTGGFLHRRFHWTRGRFTVVRTWKSKSFHP